jgi:hypothetical protein
MKRITLMCSAMVMATSLSGCVTRLTDFTIISTKNIDLSRGADFIRGEKRVQGEDTKSIIILPLGLPNAKEATDRAIESVPGAVALVDGVLEHEFFCFIFGYDTYRVKGTPLIDPKLLNNKK